MISELNSRIFLCLGNPGARYLLTRHNIGFLFGHSVIERQHAAPPRYQKEWLAFTTTIIVNDTEVLVVFPDTYMNNSGQTAAKIVETTTATPEQFTVVYDDVDLPFGKQRIRLSGGTAGHKGIASVANYLQTEKISRIRLGIGKPTDISVKSYVLQNFLDEELDYIKTVWAVRWNTIFLTTATKGVHEAMNQFNGEGIR